MNVIVGTGLAAVRAADALRDSGSSAPIVMIGAERALPYDRPPLSKEYLRGETSLEDARIHDAQYFAERNVELILGRAVKELHASDRAIELECGRRIAFDRLLIATGARPRRLLVPGEHLEGVVSLRTDTDALHLKEELARGGRVAVIGGGLIGLEVASVARAAGNDVTVIEAAPQPLARLLDGSEIASSIADLHRDHGTVVRTSTTAASLRGADRVEEIVLSTGERLRADVVLVAIGVVPNVEWLLASGVRLDDGVLTDAGLQTNVPGIFAAGDVARAFQPSTGRHERFEQYGSAHEQGIVAGRAIADRPSVANVTPGAGSEQYGIRMQVIGRASAAASVVVRGSVAKRSFAAFFLVGGRVEGAFVMDRVRELPNVRKLVVQRARIDERQIRDEAQPIQALSNEPRV